MAHSSSGPYGAAYTPNQPASVPEDPVLSQPTNRSAGGCLDLSAHAFVSGRYKQTRPCARGHCFLMSRKSARCVNSVSRLNKLVFSSRCFESGKFFHQTCMHKPQQKLSTVAHWSLRHSPSFPLPLFPQGSELHFILMAVSAPDPLPVGPHKSLP